MKYFFEDADTSALSSLFKRVYPDRFTKISGFNCFLSYECIEGMVVPDFEITGVESL